VNYYGLWGLCFLAQYCSEFMYRWLRKKCFS